MIQFLNEILGLKNQIKNSKWDLLLKQQTTDLSKFYQYRLTVYHRNNIDKDAYFFRFMYNMFFRKSAYTYFRYQRGLDAKRKQKNIWASYYTFNHKSIDFYMVLSFLTQYIVKNPFFKRDIKLFKKRKNDFFIIKMPLLRSFSVREFSNVQEDGNWAVKWHLMFYISKSHKKQQQFFSLIRKLFIR